MVKTPEQVFRDAIRDVLGDQQLLIIELRIGVKALSEQVAALTVAKPADVETPAPEGGT